MEDFIHHSKINLYPTRCNLCGGRVVYTTNDHIYGKKYGSGYCYLCTKCGAYVGTHRPRPREAFGILANLEMRNAKKICHDFFDNNFWRGKNKSRTKRLNAYAEMAELLNIPVSECHFGYFDLPMLRKAYKAMLQMKKKRDLNRIKCAKKTLTDINNLVSGTQNNKPINNIPQKEKNTMNLYQINEELKKAIEESVDTETGEILDYTRIKELKMARDEKREAVALYIKNLSADTKAIDEEIKALTARKKSKSNRAENLKQYLAKDLQDNGLNKFETPKVVLTFRKSQVLEVKSTENIPPEFFKQPEPVLDKMALKKELKLGIKYEGVTLVDKQNIQIK